MLPRPDNRTALQGFIRELLELQWCNVETSCLWFSGLHWAARRQVFTGVEAEALGGDTRHPADRWQGHNLVPSLPTPTWLRTGGADGLGAVVLPLCRAAPYT